MLEKIGKRTPSDPMETSCHCASPSDWPSVSSHDLGPNQEAGLNFIKRKMAPDNEHKKVAKATQFNDARIYKLERVGHFGWKRGKIFWRAAGSFCRSRISMVLNITRDILFWKVKVNLVDYASISSNIICRQHFLLSYLKTLSVGTAEVRTRDLPLSRAGLSQLSYPGRTSSWRP